ncbi:MAG: hypothetical protein ACPGSI_14620, partial [Pikeienuella sp.]
MPRPDHKYFAIFGAMRTGSNLLEYTLDSYRGLTGVGELFNDAFVGKPNGDPYLGVSLAERNRDPLGFLADVIEAEKGVPGFRIFPGTVRLQRSNLRRARWRLRFRRWQWERGAISAAEYRTAV